MPSYANFGGKSRGQKVTNVFYSLSVITTRYFELFTSLGENSAEICNTMASSTRGSTYIKRGDEVWSAIFYLSNPTEGDVPTLEQWPQARFIMYKTCMEPWGENMMGYVQFSNKQSYDDLYALNPWMKWKKQAYCNYTTINYVNNYTKKPVVKELVKLGEPWPTKERGVARDSVVAPEEIRIQELR